MKNYTDGVYIVEAKHKAEAFDKLAVLHGHYDIAEIIRIKKFATMDEKDFAEIDEPLNFREVKSGKTN